MKEYVLGFPLLKDMNEVILLRKYKPELKESYFNGIGGKLIKGDGYNIYKKDLIFSSMCFRFKEVTGIETNSNDWNYYLTFTDEKTYIVHCLRNFIFKFEHFWKGEYKTPINANLESFDIDLLPSYKKSGKMRILNDVDYLVLLAKNFNVDFVEIKMDI